MAQPPSVRWLKSVGICSLDDVLSPEGVIGEGVQDQAGIVDDDVGDVDFRGVHAELIDVEEEGIGLVGTEEGRRGQNGGEDVGIGKDARGDRRGRGFFSRCGGRIRGRRASAARRRCGGRGGSDVPHVDPPVGNHEFIEKREGGEQEEHEIESRDQGKWIFRRTLSHQSDKREPRVRHRRASCPIAESHESDAESHPFRSTDFRSQGLPVE